MPAHPQQSTLTISADGLVQQWETELTQRMSMGLPRCSHCFTCLNPGLRLACHTNRAINAQDAIQSLQESAANYCAKRQRTA